MGVVTIILNNQMNGKYGQFRCKNGKENGGDGCNQNKRLIFAEKTGGTMDLKTM